MNCEFNLLDSSECGYQVAVLIKINDSIYWDGKVMINPEGVIKNKAALFNQITDERIRRAFITSLKKYIETLQPK